MPGARRRLRNTFRMSDRGDVARPDDVSRDPATFGNVGQRDPHADPVTEPGLRPVGEVEDEKTVDLRPQAEPAPPPQRTVFSGLYIGLVLAALVLVLLLIFILQNDAPVDIHFLWFSGRLPSGVALLLAAILGVLLVAIPGSGRIMQLRRAARRAERRQ